MKSFLLIIMMILPLAGQAVGSVKAGAKKAKLCIACHNADGNSTINVWPKIAGQHESYFIKQLKDYKKGKKGSRYNVTMENITRLLSPQDMADLAAYFAQQKVTHGSTKPDLLERGRNLYRGGDLTKHIPACSACHGPHGKGNAWAGFPALAGQHMKYTEAQMSGFRNGKRSNDINGIMRDIAMRMSKKDMEAVSSYIEGLH